MNKVTDPIIDQLLKAELERQQTTINLIASENYTDQAVLTATGSVLTNKYAEGYPGKRYYAGCSVVDVVEQVAIDRCKEIFGAEYANVQPHSGSQANMAAFYAVLKPGDTLLGMSLSEGGHLTHGYPLNFSGNFYRAIGYSVDRATEQLDYDEIERLALEHKPKLIIAGASAYSRILDFERFGAIAKKSGALFMADIAHIAGLVAAGVHPNPFPHADIVTSTTHKTLRGPRGGIIMAKASLGSAIDKAILPGIQGGPCMNVIAAKAVAFGQIMQPSFKEYARQIIANAQAMADEFIAMGYRIVAGGTQNHLFVIDLTARGITGKVAEHALERAGITVSRSCIPFDTQKPALTSGFRIGTPAITTRGLQESHMRAIAKMIDAVITNHDNELIIQDVRAQVRKMCELFPLYPAMMHQAKGHQQYGAYYCR